MGRQKLNVIGKTREEYKGRASTLCAGCGHDSISSRIIQTCFEMGIKPNEVLKMSGIGCSSKTPAYWLSQSHGFNSTHGRMPSMTTGAVVANHSMIAIGVSGDGDTGSIGFGQFKHAMRRNIPMIYIVENNGVYGLTKGQFSATADQGQTTKYYGTNKLPAIDLCMEAIISDATFVARSFAGDPRQVTALLKAALSHDGIALLDIISPCVTFNNHESSTKSYPYGKANEEPLHDINYVPVQEEITVDYDPGEVRIVKMHDGSLLQLRKLNDDYDPTDRIGAIRMLEHAKDNQEFATGLIYIDQSRSSFTALENLVDTPLAWLDEDVLRPTPEALAEVMADLL